MRSASKALSGMRDSGLRSSPSTGLPPGARLTTLMLGTKAIRRLSLSMDEEPNDAQDIQALRQVESPPRVL